MNCWLAQFSNVACDGQLVRAHLIARQRLVREVTNRLPNEEAFKVIWDERVWVPACGGPTGIGGHHGQFDGCTLLVPRSGLPEGLEAFAAEHGLGWVLDREFGLLEAAA